MGFQGQPLGAVCIVHNQPLSEVELSKKLLRLFAIRASAEIERREAVQALQELNNSLEARINERTEQLREANTQLQQGVAEREQAETQIKTSLQEKELLLREIHHRIKNNLMVVSSLLEFQTDTVNDPQALQSLADSQHRIDAMALIHEKLYRADSLSRIDLGDYLQALAEELYQAYNVSGDHIHFSCELASVPVNIETAHPCGLLVNELLSNAFKHAFPEQRSGTVTLRLQPHETGELILTVSDDGIGLPDDMDVTRTQSLGMYLVNTLSRQLKGKLAIETQAGTTVRLCFRELKYQQRV